MKHVKMSAVKKNNKNQLCVELKPLRVTVYLTHITNALLF